MHDADRWNLSILATDIDERCLESTRRAVYGERSVKDVPEAYMTHLTKLDEESYAVVRDTAKLVEVRHLNLSDRIAMRTIRDMDFIFCRNVLIYFDDASRKAVVERFYTSMNRGAYIYLGHSESVGRISTAFKLKRVGTHLVYCKE